MKIVKTIVAGLLFCGAALFAEQIDTGQWVKIPITFGYVEGDDCFNPKEEIVEISFPVEPTVFFGFYNATDEEGMSYVLTAMEISEEAPSLSQVMDSLIEAVEQSPTAEVIGYVHPADNPHLSRYSILFAERDVMTHLMIVKSAHFIYILQVSVSDEIYKDLNSFEPESPAYDKVLKDTNKASAFFNSFKGDSLPQQQSCCVK